MNEKLILIVDDEVGILIAYKRLLQDDNVIIETATTIEQAEDLLKTKHFQVVIADLRLTGILGREGLEIIRYVKEKNLETECILVTAYGNPEIKKEALEVGARYYFEKPVSGKVLREALVSMKIYS